MRLPTLRAARHRAGLTQRELAERAGLTRVTVGNLERGQACRPGTARKLSEALVVPIAELMGHGVLATAGRQGNPDAVWAQVSPDDEDQGGSDR